MYSNYRGTTTLKILVSIAPNGAFTFISPCYPGFNTDKKIVQVVFVPQLVHGRHLLVDKGFLLDDILPQDVSYSIPTFADYKQFTVLQVVRNYNVAETRVHVERKIQRLKMYKIFSYVRTSQWKYISKLVRVCAALSDLGTPILKEMNDYFMCLRVAENKSFPDK